MLKTGLISFILYVISNNAYAHGMPKEYLAVVFVIGMWPAIIALGLLIIAFGHTLINKSSRKWYLASLIFILIQFPWYIFIKFTGILGK